MRSRSQWSLHICRVSINKVICMLVNSWILSGILFPWPSLEVVLINGSNYIWFKFKWFIFISFDKFCMELPLWNPFLFSHVSCSWWSKMVHNFLAMIAIFFSSWQGRSSYTCDERIDNWWSACSNLVVLARTVEGSKNDRGISRSTGHKHQSQNNDDCFSTFLSIETGCNYYRISSKILI